MDRIDRLSIWAIVILIISSFALISGHIGEARPERQVRQKTEVAVPSVAGEVESSMKMVINLMEAQSYSKAEPLLKELIRKYPYEAAPHMVMGDMLMRKQDSVSAMFEYKEATDLNPDYLDKKTSVFQGKKLKNAVKEAMEELNQRIKAHPGDEALKKDRKTIHYLQRRIAGSCS